MVTAWTSAFLRLILLLPSHPAVAKDSPAMCAPACRPFIMPQIDLVSQNAEFNNPDSCLVLRPLHGSLVL